jgi:hypothetical protein
MQVSHRKKFIFLKTVKTASTSIEQTLQKYCSDKEYIFGSELGGPDELNEDFSHKESSLGIITVPLFFSDLNGEVVKSYYWDHMPAEELRDKIDPNIWENYFKFCVVRNPFEKVLSIFSFIIRNNSVGENVPIKALFEVFLPIILETPLFFDRMVYTINEEVCVDRILRYETLEEDFSNVCDILDIPYENLPKINNQYRKKGITCKDMYTDYTKKLVFDRYSFEIEKFGYKFPD